MSAIANFLARFTWWWCLWLMRRPWMKALQRRSTYLFPKSYRGTAHVKFIKQNQFARRNGVRILAFIFNLFLAYIFVLCAYVLVVSLNDKGYFSLPDDVTRRVAK